MILASLTLRSFLRCLGAVLALPVLCSLGCHSEANLPANGDATALPAINIFAIDRSGSTAHLRKMQKKALNMGFTQSGTWGDSVAVYVVDSKTACVYTPQEAKAVVKAPDLVLRAVDTAGGGRGKGTKPALLWEELASQYAAPPAPRVVRIVYITDGDNDWAADAPRITAAINKLAENPRVYVAIVGLDKDQFAQIRNQFAPFADNRATFTVGDDESQMSDTLTRVLQKE